jgi:hypothetical protein
MKNKNPSVEEMITVRDDLLSDLHWQKVVERCGSMLDQERAVLRIFFINGEVTRLNREINDAIAARKAKWRQTVFKTALFAAGFGIGVAIYQNFLKA